MGTHGFSKNLYPYPPKTRTRDQGYGFLRVQVQVWAEIPQGYPWQSLNAPLHVIGFIKNMIDYGITYSQDAELSPIAFVDADYGGCRDTCWSTSGYIFTMAGGPVSWSSKRQATVALSTVEAEYVSMSQCAQ